MMNHFMRNKHEINTIHGLDKHLDRAIQSLADREGLSMNKTIKKVLRSALGLDD